MKRMKTKKIDQSCRVLETCTYIAQVNKEPCMVHFNKGTKQCPNLALHEGLFFAGLPMDRSSHQYYRIWTMLGFTSGELLSGTMAANILRSIQNLHSYTSFLLPILFIFARYYPRLSFRHNTGPR